MTSVNRTSEFFAICQSLPPADRGSTKPLLESSATSKGRYSGESNVVSRSEPTHELRSFHKLASQVSQEIHATSTLLSELTTLIQSSSRSLFASEESDQLINNLVLRIKTKIESLHIQLDDAATIIAQNKRKKLGGGKNHQAEMEASNLVGQLKEEFVSTTKGFKEILQVRSDRIRERSEKKLHLLSDSTDKTSLHENRDSMVLMGNKPRVYDDAMKISGKEKMTFGTPSGAAMGGGESKFTTGPLLDLTSPLLAAGGTFGRQENETMPSGENTTQLPRPSTFSYSLFHKVCSIHIYIPLFMINNN